MSIEKRFYDYLNEQLEAPVYLERPKEIHGDFVLIERTAGSKTNQLSTATIVCQSHSSSMLNAVALNAAVKTAMESAKSLTNIFSMKLNSDYNYTNQSSFKGYRYQAVFIVVYKEDE